MHRLATIAIATIAVALCGCATQRAVVPVKATELLRTEKSWDGKPLPEYPRLKIVATTFPFYDWTREVLGDRLAETDLVLLQQSGVDLHSYSPSAADLRQIAACDLFVFVGGEDNALSRRDDA